jgi:hypothetical protein
MRCDATYTYDFPSNAEKTVFAWSRLVGRFPSQVSALFLMTLALTWSVKDPLNRLYYEAINNSSTVNGESIYGYDLMNRIYWTSKLPKDLNNLNPANFFVQREFFLLFRTRCSMPLTRNIKKLIWIAGITVCIPLLLLLFPFASELLEETVYGPIVYILKPSSTGFYITVQGPGSKAKTKIFTETTVIFGNENVIVVPDVGFSSHWRKQIVREDNGETSQLAELSSFAFTGKKQLFLLNSGTNTKIRWNCYFVGVTKPPDVEAPPEELIEKAMKMEGFSTN